MSFIVDPSVHMWFAVCAVIGAILMYSRDKMPLDASSVALVVVLLMFGQMFPLLDENGSNMLSASKLLSGFSNTSLIAVLCLLIMGQGIMTTDALRPVVRLFRTSSKQYFRLAFWGILLFVLVVSAFLNNAPLVVIAIPIMQVLAQSMRIPESRVMIPLSYAAILGGMMTLVGSSTNLLVASTIEELGMEPLGFFDFFIPGSIMAAVGLLYVLFVLPFLLPSRTSMTQQLMSGEKEFVAELDIEKDSPLIGMECVEGSFPVLPGLSVRMIQRSGHLILPPFEGYEIEEGDIMIVAATRQTLTDLLAKFPGFLLSNDQMEAQKSRQTAAEESNESKDETSTRVLAEIMVTPASRYIDMSLEQIGIEHQYGGVILGIQRRARVVRRRLGRIRLEAGDVLLVAGSQADINNMRMSRDVIVLSGSRQELPLPKKAPVAGLIFLGTIVSAATGLIAIPVAALTGAALMVATGCLNMRQAVRAFDRKIYLLVGSALALGTTLDVTGAARAMAETLLTLPIADKPLLLCGVFFLIVAIATNLLTNNACAILFTPIGINLAQQTGLDPFFFAVTVIFAANCSFASPIGYKTNLLVMGPGHYRFKDFMKAGVPLVFVLMFAYLAVAHFYFGI